VVTWAADGYSEADVVIVTVSSISYLDSSTEQPDAGSVVCTAPATAGQLSIPSSLLRRIPAAPPLNGIPYGIVFVHLRPRPSQRGDFDLPLAGGGSHKGLLDYVLRESLRTVIQ
jgi:hypothetical protein